ncbi:hypothetical protein [Paraburkholderia terrae]|uniref:hypothetical protein n=1 Tax=Paraburkholderia terrae TaxID=311230 RepID=UPI0012E07C77|nr:hypothetical protein [Paraburkholderia terrae]
MSNATGNTAGGTLLSNIASGAAGAAAGGALGGALGGAGGAQSGANGALGADLYNRQLHQAEKSLSQQLAKAANAKGLTNADGSPVTTADIANQLAQMGYQANGVLESGAAATVKGEMPDDGSTWKYAGVDQTSGKAIWAQTPGPANPVLQAFILQNTNGSDVPLLQQYTSSPVGAQSQYGPQGISMGSSAGSICPQGDCGVAYSTPSQQQVSDAAGFGATQLDRVAAMATALSAAGMPVPFVSASAEAIAVWASAGSWFLNGVQQAASPNFGGYSVSNAIGQFTGAITNRYPMAAPVINEFGSITSNSGVAQNAQDWINTQWAKVKGKFQ